VAIDEQRITDVPTNDGQLFYVQIVQILNDMNASSPGAVCWLNDPGVTLGVRLLDLQEMRVEFTKLVRQDVGVRNEVVLTCTKLLLRPDIVVTETIFAGDLITLRKMVDSLILIQPFVKE
jgi:hypothetical protein